MMKRNPSIALFVLTVLAAAIVGALTPSIFPENLFSEGGPIEELTLVLYVVGIIAVLMAPGRVVGKVDKLATCILLAAFAAREMDLHTAMYGTSILKARFYNRDGTAAQIAGALAVLLPIFASIGWLLVKHGKQWLRALRERQPAAVTFLVFGVALVVAKLSDRAPDTLSGWNMTVSMTVRHIMQGIEESLEMFLPIFIAMAVWQAARYALPRAQSAMRAV
ncbi:hypothetical protein FXN63_03410 [Pigmentiphaga aceris]|uniref:Uncharacterized protein n=1 Tax=Pigmentiphaga aceris TaxID=1940612 RepID=A0A5C0ATJ0_9BURK|nr:hypothetical protein [Pigmentiphaga aceris]QEI04996.1 hypothetical protein FXN63_03410 [Pigmentiphaga aceris]